MHFMQIQFIKHYPRIQIYNKPEHGDHDHYPPGHLAVKHIQF